MQSPLTRTVAFAALLMLRPCIAAPIAHTPLVQQFDSLDRNAKQVFLRFWLVERFDKAARIAISEDERERKSLRYADVLKRVAAGDVLSSRGLNQLIDEVANIEKRAIDQLSLRYRVRVYGRFRAERAEYDRRMAVWRKLISAWEATDARAPEGAKVIDWLQVALDRMRYDEAAVLPALPRFSQWTEPQIATKAPAATRGSLPLLGPTEQTTPRHVSADPPMKLPAALSRQPAIDNLSNTLPNSPRMAHRAEKPTVPKVEPPPRGVVHDVSEVTAPPESLRTLDQTNAEPHVMIDLEELSVRIRGYNLAIQELSAVLQNEDTWTNERLAEALDELADLADRRSQLSLYRELISADEQQHVGAMSSLDASVALLGAKIFSAREALLASEDENSSSVAALNELSHKLATLAAKRAR